jgi:peptidylprolyl isomerase
VRRRSALLAVPALLLTAAGCGSQKKSDPASSTSPSAAGGSGAAGVKIVSGPVPDITAGTKFGQKPTVAKGTGTPTSNLAVKAVIAGSGAAIASGDYIEADYLGQIYATGKVFDNSYDRHAPFVTQIGAGKVIPGWDKGLVGQKAGSRVEMSIPPAQGYGSAGQPQAGIKGTDTLVFVIDVINTFGATSSAKGKVAAQTDASLPKIGTNTDGKDVAITVPKGKAPSKLVSQYVIEGDGKPVKGSDTLLLQYKGVLWDGGKEFDATYSRKQLASFPLGELIPGWKQGLVGKKVGSRVMLVVPPALGYGSQGSQGVPGNATLVFSLDILAATS